MTISVVSANVKWFCWVHSQYIALPSVSGASSCVHQCDESTCISFLLFHLCYMTTHTTMWRKWYKIFWHNDWDNSDFPGMSACDLVCFQRWRKSTWGRPLCSVMEVIEGVWSTHVSSSSRNNSTHVICYLPQIWDKAVCMAGGCFEDIPFQSVLWYTTHVAATFYTTHTEVHKVQ